MMFDLLSKDTIKWEFTFWKEESPKGEVVG